MDQAIDAMRDAIQDLAAAQQVLELSNNKDVGIELIF